jgi:hypothetical protein
MKPLEFLADVLPSPGHGLYCVAELSTRKKEHCFINSLEEIKPHVKRWLDKHRNIFFALATFDEKVQHLTKERRTAVNARYIKSIFLDLDGYESKKVAAEALSAFLSKTGLDQFATPHVLSSGGGLHCYWPLNKEADIETWRPIAENLKRLCKQEGMHIDMSVTSDAARVLRIPGTFNFKDKYPEPRPVKILIQGSGPIDLMHFGATIRSLLTEAYAPASNAFVAEKVELAGTRPIKANSKKSALAEAMLSNSVTRFETIWLKTEQGSGCGQLQHYIDNAQADGMEPLWRALLSWTKVCEDAAEYSVRLSQLHPYEPSRMHQKLSEIKGPYPCVKLDSENPGVCPKCPHWGKITNALALGREVVGSTDEKVYEIPLHAAQQDVESEAVEYLEDGITSDEDEEGIEHNRRIRLAKRPSAPRGFIYGKNGGVFAEIKEKDATGVVIKTQVPVLPYDLFVVDMLRMEEKEHYAHLMAIKTVGPADDPEKQSTEYTPIIMPSKAVVAKDELLKCLAAHNIYAERGIAMDPYLYSYVRACVSESALMKKAVDVPTQFGWQKNNSFVYNNRIFSPDGSEVIVPMPGLENINAATNSKGSLEEWRKPWELLIRRQMYTMLAICLDSFGSTLLRLSEFEGFVWHIGSTESGTGKSLTLSLKAGVWGHPLRYRTGKGTSLVALQQRAGLLNSLPLLIDEITTKARSDAEWLSAFVFDTTEGKGKERMESGTNKERINNSAWALTATTTANIHMSDVLLGARDHASNGEMMRYLEWNPSEELQFNSVEREILKLLRRNYGVAGEAWVRWTVANQSTVRKVWLETHEQLRQIMKFSDEERYWHAGCTSDVAAAILLGPSYSNILTVPVQGVSDALLKLVISARSVHARARRSAEDVLNTYTREFYGKFVVIRRGEDDKFVTEWNMSAEGKTSTRNTVMGRIEHGSTHPDYIEYFIEEQLLRKHCASMSFGYTDFKNKLEAGQKEGGYAVRFGVKKDMLARTDGPALRVTCMHFRVRKEKVSREGQVSVGQD